MDKSEVKQHILYVLDILIELADQFELQEIHKELVACNELIHAPTIDQILKSEVIHYHTADDE
jgi:hypothetical protein